MKSISIYHRDREYLLAAAERLALLLKGVDVFPADGPDAEGKVYVMEDHMPMSAAAEEISEMLGLNAGAGSGIILTGFVSGAGGSGTSASALMYAGYLADCLGQKTAFVSLDPLGCKACLGEGPAGALLYSALFEGRTEAVRDLFKRDGRGVFRMAGEGPRNPLGLLSSADLIGFLKAAGREFGNIVLDVPCASAFAPDVLEVCDSVVVCFGWQEDRYAPSEALHGILSGRRDRVFRFFPSFDESFSDPYGQLGAEVRALARLIG